MFYEMGLRCARTHTYRGLKLTDQSLTSNNNKPAPSQDPCSQASQQMRSICGRWCPVQVPDWQSRNCCCLHFSLWIPSWKMQPHAGWLTVIWNKSEKWLYLSWFHVLSRQLVVVYLADAELDSADVTVFLTWFPQTKCPGRERRQSAFLFLPLICQQSHLWNIHFPQKVPKCLTSTDLKIGVQILNVIPCVGKKKWSNTTCKNVWFLDHFKYSLTVLKETGQSSH